jgi:hypothetical protein
VERRIEDAKAGRGTWKKIATLAAGAAEYRDADVKNAQQVAYRVRAINMGGESAYSNVARIPLSAK